MTLDLEGTKPKHPDSDICLWRYQVNVQVWKGDCDLLFNAKLFQQTLHGAKFYFCPKCGKKMVREKGHG